MANITKAQADKAIRSRRGIVERIAGFPRGIAEQIGRYGNRKEGPMCRALAALTTSHQNPLAQGNREAEARRRWPEDKWPTLYIKWLPGMEDVQRSLVMDGRLPGGIDVSHLAYRHLEAEVVDGAWTVATEHGSRAALLAGAAAATVVLGCTFFLGGGIEAHYGPWPSWSPDWSMPRILYVAQVVLDTVIRASVGLGLAGLSVPFLATAFSTFAFLNHIRGWLARAAEPLQTPTRDALAIWANNSVERDRDYEALTSMTQRAFELAKKGSPFFPIGIATGSFLEHGKTFAPMAGQIIGLDADSICQHAFVVGETGSGKTSRFLQPLIDRMLRANFGDGRKLGAYVTDGKDGVLWKDIRDLPSVQARKQDIVVVGTEEGECGMDLLAGRSPVQIASLFLAVCEQTGGKTSDPIWQESAANLIMYVATIAKPISLDTVPLAEGDVPLMNNPTWRDFTPNSIMGIALLASSKSARADALNRIRDIGQLLDAQIQTGGGRNHITMPEELVAVIENADTQNACRYFTEEWETLAPETSSSIVMNVGRIFNKLKASGELRNRFCNGKPPKVPKIGADGNVELGDGGEAKMVDMPQTSVMHALTGGFLFNAIGTGKHGLAGTMVSLIIKTNLYIEAMARLAADPNGDCTKYRCAVVVDECQKLLTTGPDSDVDVLGVARASGVFVVAGTQSIAALEQRLGRDGCRTIMQLFCNKIFLSTQEREAHDLAVYLAGTTLRGLISVDNLYATQAQREKFVPDRSPGLGFSGFSLETVMPTSPSVAVGLMRQAVAVDERFILPHRTLSNGQNGNPAQTNVDAVVGSRGAAAHRQEDKNREALTAGVSRQNLLLPEDLERGGGAAFVILKRGGENVMDLVNLDKLLAKEKVRDEAQKLAA